MKAMLTRRTPCYATKLSTFLITVALIVGMLGCGPDTGDTLPLQYDLIISSTAGGSVTTPGEGTSTHNAGTVVNLVAEAEEDYRFVNWSGDVLTIDDVNAASTTINMDNDYSITASFEEIPPVQYDLSISSTVGGEVTTPGEGTYTYDAGTVVALVASPADGCRFVGWTGNVGTIGNVDSVSTTITMNGDYSITASFEEEEAVYFADPNLEAAVREAIGVPEGPIYPADMEWLSELDARERNIQDLAGLEHCTFLLYLNAGSNEISDTSPLANLTNLMFLRLDSNQISDISPLANLTNLNSLRLDSNQISDISPLANLTNLNSLALDSNEISDVSALAGLTKLRVVGLMNNQISDISPLTSLTGLTDLYILSNQISDISALANLTSLERLFLEANEISDISALANLTSLTRLFLSSNQISDISPLTNLINLTGLWLNDNQISDISPLVENEGFSEGDQIDLRENPLSSDSINTYIPQLEARGVSVDY